MSGKATGVIYDSDVPEPFRKVLLAYADHADHLGMSVFPSVGLIAWKCLLSDRQVQRITKTMIKKGWLVRVGESQWGTNEYRIMFDRLPARPPYVFHPRGRPQKWDDQEEENGDMGVTVIPEDNSENGDILAENGDISAKKGDSQVSHKRQSSNGNSKRQSVHASNPLGDPNGADSPFAEPTTPAKPKTPEPDMIGQMQEMLNCWLVHFPEKPQPKLNNVANRTLLAARWKDPDFRNQWRLALEKAASLAALHTKDASWFDFNWFLNTTKTKGANYARVLAGNYDWMDANMRKEAEISTYRAEQERKKQYHQELRAADPVIDATGQMISRLGL